MNALRQARTEAGLTLKQLSEKSGVALETIRRLEKDEHKPHPRTLKKIADALGIPVSGLSQALNRVEVFVGGPGPGDLPGTGELQGELLNFRGEEVKNWMDEAGMNGFTLYKCPDGYRVYHAFLDEQTYTLLPNQNNPVTGETEYLTYTAEEVAEKFPVLRPTLGIYPVRYID